MTMDNAIPESQAHKLTMEERNEFLFFIFYF